MNRWIQIGADLLSLDNVALVRRYCEGETFLLEIFHYGSEYPLSYRFETEKKLAQVLQDIQLNMFHDS